MLGSAACLCKGPEVEDERDVRVKLADVAHLEREARQGAAPLAEHPHLPIRVPQCRNVCITLQCRDEEKDAEGATGRPRRVG